MRQTLTVNGFGNDIVLTSQVATAKPEKIKFSQR